MAASILRTKFPVKKLENYLKISEEKLNLLKQITIIGQLWAVQADMYVLVLSKYNIYCIK